MRQFCLRVLFILAALALAQTQLAVPQVNRRTQPASIRILTPVAGQTLTTDFVVVRFEAAQPDLSDEPSFLIQLDDRDPVHTTSTNYTFTDLQPGIHTVTVALVDANKNPVQGGAASVQFKVSVAGPSAQNNSPLGARSRSGQMVAGAFPSAPIPPELRHDGDIRIPVAGSPLPMLSLIGFGLLIGGAVQTMRQRHLHAHR